MRKKKKITKATRLRAGVTQRDSEIWRENSRWEWVGGEDDGTLSYSLVVKAINSL